MLDKKNFLDEIRAVTVIAVFIFVLAVINQCAKTNDQILSAGTMEMAGYVTFYNSHYDEGGNFARRGAQADRGEPRER